MDHKKKDWLHSFLLKTEGEKKKRGKAKHSVVFSLSLVCFVSVSCLSEFSVSLFGLTVQLFLNLFPLFVPVFLYVLLSVCH